MSFTSFSDKKGLQIDFSGCDVVDCYRKNNREGNKGLNYKVRNDKVGNDKV